MLPIEWNRDCVDGYCGVSFCSQECGADLACPSGFVANYVDSLDKCMCFPCWDGFPPNCPGAPCSWETTNDNYPDCAAGLTCLGSDNAGSCPDGSATECNDVAESWNPDCVDGICGYSFCAEHCDEQGNCPARFEPQDVLGYCFCVPTD